jgi:hypothetical protein
MGSSAGGHLVAMLGVTDGSEGLEGTSADLSLSSRVQAVVDYFGPTDLTAVANSTDSAILAFLGGTCAQKPLPCWQASPVKYASPDDPPFLIVHGTKDARVPYQQSVALRDALQAVGVDVELLLLEGSRARMADVRNDGQGLLRNGAVRGHRVLRPLPRGRQDCDRRLARRGGDAAEAHDFEHLLEPWMRADRGHERLCGEFGEPRVVNCHRLIELGERLIQTACGDEDERGARVPARARECAADGGQAPFHVLRAAFPRGQHAPERVQDHLGLC